MRKMIAVLLLSFIICEVTARADNDDFIFGIWTYGLPINRDVDDLFSELKFALHSNPPRRSSRVADKNTLFTSELSLGIALAAW